MRGPIQIVCIVCLLVLGVSCTSTKEVIEQKPVEVNQVEQNIVDRNGFRELRVFTVTFEYANSNKLSFTVEVEPKENVNAMDTAFHRAEKIATQDSTVVSYSVRPGKYMTQLN